MKAITSFYTQSHEVIKGITIGDFLATSTKSGVVVEVTVYPVTVKKESTYRFKLNTGEHLRIGFNSKGKHI